MTQEATPTTTTKRQPKRKFLLQIGHIEVVQRSTVDGMYENVAGSPGVKAVLHLDGYEFEMLGPIIE